MIPLPKVRFGEAYTVWASGSDPVIRKIEQKAQEQDVPCIILDQFPVNPKLQTKRRPLWQKPHLVITGKDAEPMMARKNELKTKFARLLELKSQNRDAANQFLSNQWVINGFREWSNSWSGFIAEVLKTPAYKERLDDRQNANKKQSELRQQVSTTYREGLELKRAMLVDFLPWLHQVAQNHRGGIDQSLAEDRLDTGAFDVKTGGKVEPGLFPMDYLLERVGFQTIVYDNSKRQYITSAFDDNS